MKKLLTVTLALALALGLTSCGGKENDAPLYNAADVTAIDEAGAFDADLYDLEGLDADIAFMLYRLEEAGLEREDLTSCSGRRSAGATCEEAVVLVFTDSDKAETAVDALKDYIQHQIDENTDYRPAEIPKLENAYIDRRGESVLMVVAGDIDAAKKAVE